MALDLHALANQPGAGRAVNAIKAAGCWREEGPMPRWTVFVDLSVSVDQCIDVAASTEEAARAAVMKFDGWDVDGEVHDVTIRSIKPDLNPIFDATVVGD